MPCEDAHMYTWQEKYAENMKTIARLADFYTSSLTDSGQWYRERISAQKEILRLKEENLSLLNGFFFPCLDQLHNSSEEDILALEEFGDVLMDWNSNLDCGIYIQIHDALLSLYRFRRDRNHVIRELYKLGMGLYYQSRRIQGVDRSRTEDIYFENEMVFTEAGSYLKFFEEIPDEETRGYIIRSLANIALCTQDKKRRVAISGRILKIVQDPYYRELAPSLPWDVFLRRTHQQMSATREVLSRGNMTPTELAMVMESCQVVFEPEKTMDTPNVRWLWPYYEMEYSCGFTDIYTTLSRMEWLITRIPEDQYDESGLYANVQLPIYYGRLLSSQPSLLETERYTEFLAFAYQRMMNVLMSYPAGGFTDFMSYLVNLVLTDYVEIDGVESYRSVVRRLMQRLSGKLYIESRTCGELLKVICGELLNRDPAFFDDIPEIRMALDPESKRQALTDYAAACGLYHNVGLMKMNMQRLNDSRNMFESEFRMYQLHSACGYDDLKKRKSTEMFAEVALGHHRWYSGAGGYPEDYIRNESQYRQMCDAVAVADALIEEYRGDIHETVRKIAAQEQKRFSPLIIGCLENEGLREELDRILSSDHREFYLEIFNTLAQKNIMDENGI